jgi:predicted dehydrogenase
VIKVRPRQPVRVFEYLDEGASPIEVDIEQPLAAECRDFLDCIRRRREPRAGGKNAVTVLRVLEAAEKSQRAGGREVKVKGETAA